MSAGKVGRGRGGRPGAILWDLTRRAWRRLAPPGSRRARVIAYVWGRRGPRALRELPEEGSLAP